MEQTHQNWENSHRAIVLGRLAIPEPAILAPYETVLGDSQGIAAPQSARPLFPRGTPRVFQPFPVSSKPLRPIPPDEERAISLGDTALQPRFTPGLPVHEVGLNRARATDNWVIGRGGFELRESDLQPTPQSRRIWNYPFSCNTACKLGEASIRLFHLTISAPGIIPEVPVPTSDRVLEPKTASPAPLNTGALPSPGEIGFRKLHQSADREAQQVRLISARLRVPIPPIHPIR